MQLLLPDRHIEARVVWSNARFFGVVFRHALPRLDLFALLQRYRRQRGALSDHREA